jgi:UDP-N-acetylmuramoylalanine--D-glutamate ligase
MDEYVQAKLAVAEHTEGLVIDIDSQIPISALNTPIFAAVSDTLNYTELSRLLPAEKYFTLDAKKAIILLNGSPFADVSNAVRRERYNIKNFMLAAAATSDEASAKICSRVLNSFAGLSHRNELVCKACGIDFYDSSIDTSPDRALATLSTYKQPPIVIICGKSKGGDYSELAQRLPNVTRGAVFMGDVGRTVADLLPSGYTRYAECDSMNGAVRRALDMARECGSAVVLCPAGTSYDKYANFEERGDDFKKEVCALI